MGNVAILAYAAFRAAEPPAANPDAVFRTRQGIYGVAHTFLGIRSEAAPLQSTIHTAGTWAWTIGPSGPERLLSEEVAALPAESEFGAVPKITFGVHDENVPIAIARGSRSNLRSASLRRLHAGVAGVAVLLAGVSPFRSHTIRS